MTSVQDLLTKMELKARKLHEKDPITANLLLYAAQVIDAGRLIREGVDKERNVVHPQSLAAGILCWDKLVGGGE